MEIKGKRKEGKDGILHLSVDTFERADVRR